jgi:hypothetical protein
MENEFRKYWHPEFREWHENKIGTYHVSSVGLNHQDLEPEEHSGPCIRETWYEYTDPIPDRDETVGNFEMGNDIHKPLQEIIKKWKPHVIVEKPLKKIINNKGRMIKAVGSIDIEYQHNCAKTDTEKVKISIWDIKSASKFTLPSGKYDRSPTHFSQVSIYAVMDDFFSLHPDWNIVVRVKIIYVSKHNKATFTQRQKYQSELADEIWDEFCSRVCYLDDCLVEDILPEREPHKWCLKGYCKYKNRCRADVKHDAEVPKYDEDEMQKMFKEETGKNAIYHGKITKGYTEWKAKL